MFLEEVKNEMSVKVAFEQRILRAKTKEDIALIRADLLKETTLTKAEKDALEVLVVAKKIV
jgi:hypothetical protein